MGLKSQCDSKHLHPTSKQAAFTAERQVKNETDFSVTCYDKIGLNKMTSSCSNLHCSQDMFSVICCNISLSDRPNKDAFLAEFMYSVHERVSGGVIGE